MASIFLRFLTILIGVGFIFIGHLKLTPQFFPDDYKRIQNDFGKFNNEFPFYRQTGWRPYAKNYRIAIGLTEVSCGLLLLVGLSQSLANIILLMIMTNELVTLQKLNFSLERTMTTIVISSLLVLRLVLVSRSKAKQMIQSAKEKVK